jgi:hypothetical protein
MRAAALRHRRRVGAVAAVAVLHGMVLWLLGVASGPRPAWRPFREPVPVARVEPAPITWADVAPATRHRSVPMLPAAEKRPSGRTPSATAAASKPDRPAPAPRPATAGPSATASVPGPVVGGTDAPSSAGDVQAPAPEPAPAPLQRTLRKDALRDLASERRPWQDDPRLASKPPASAGSRLEAGTAEAAQGDCLRGEFKGNGMGLLSLPMMGLAAAQGRCRMP